MPARKKRPSGKKAAPCCGPGEIEINGKCYRLYLILSSVQLPRGADCGISRRTMIDVGEDLGKLGIQKKSSSRKKRK